MINLLLPNLDRFKPILESTTFIREVLTSLDKKHHSFIFSIDKDEVSCEFTTPRLTLYIVFPLDEKNDMLSVTVTSNRYHSLRKAIIPADELDSINLLIEPI